MGYLMKLVLATALTSSVAVGVVRTTARFADDFVKVAVTPSREPAPTAQPPSEVDGGVCAAPEKLVPSS